MSDGAGAEDVVAWSTATEPHWATSVGQWPWQELRASDSKTVIGWYKRGQCPRCRHEISVRQNRGAHLVPPRPTLLARCNCDAVHANRPDWAPDGCGSSGSIRRANVDAS